MAPWFERDITTVRIPKQSRGGRHTPLVIVVPEHRTWKQRAAAAIGRAAWKRRRAFLPSLLALFALLGTAILHGTSPAIWPLPVLAALVGPAWLIWAEKQRPACATRVRAWRYALAAAWLTAGAWAAAAIAYGPLSGPLPLLWLALTITGHAVRRHLHNARSPEPTSKETA
ncbi:hypothetical protein I5Q34_08135 [Streptomyces sp. AV19]|uniref:hypothetical protein n=1 Tax=Streptomyces sp. AV19 TaxID=2793068 RepID=UPI0018FE0ED0|nr:hypothetical protein [Streptomyces sp. AV19]MBH1934263.1 hypothetical protein [Streptomyces sp. AV19]MDG4533427.1 hypothetical protein [Streptomyces sp. AV19]